MPLIELRSESGMLPPIDLGQVDIGLTNGDTPALPIVVINRDKFDLSEIRVSTDGPGASAVQLARDLDQKPGVWTDGEIIALAGVLPPNRSCRFWARVIAEESLELGEQDFEFVINAIAIKEE